MLLRKVLFIVITLVFQVVCAEPRSGNHPVSKAKMYLVNISEDRALKSALLIDNVSKQFCESVMVQNRISSNTVHIEMSSLLNQFNNIFNQCLVKADIDCVDGIFFKGVNKKCEALWGELTSPTVSIEGCKLQVAKLASEYLVKYSDLNDNSYYAKSCSNFNFDQFWIEKELYYFTSIMDFDSDKKPNKTSDCRKSLKGDGSSDDNTYFYYCRLKENMNSDSKPFREVSSPAFVASQKNQAQAE